VGAAGAGAGALDADYLAGLGLFDVVYSWGVLHHTGDMWRSLDLVAGLVRPGGRLFLAIYNDQGTPSKVWRRVKARYNRGGPLARRLLVAGAGTYFWLKSAPYVVKTRLTGGSVAARGRGMDRRRDLVDWVGGYPFEVAMPEAVFGFFRDRGFVLDRLKTCRGGIGCNEYVFTAPSGA